LYKDLIPFRNDWFDFSSLNPENPFYFGANKKKLGCFTDETDGIPISEFVGLKPKLYAFLYGDDAKEIKKAKGVGKNAKERELKFEHFKKCVFDHEVKYANVTSIRSLSHQPYTLNTRKLCLNPIDTKRWILDDKIHTLAHGHYKTRALMSNNPN
jgi:hypothetical protein